MKFFLCFLFSLTLCQNVWCADAAPAAAAAAPGKRPLKRVKPNGHDEVPEGDNIRKIEKRAELLLPLVSAVKDQAIALKAALKTRITGLKHTDFEAASNLACYVGTPQLIITDAENYVSIFNGTSPVMEGEDLITKKALAIIASKGLAQTIRDISKDLAGHLLGFSFAELNRLADGISGILEDVQNYEFEIEER